jgi:hypothetical protein
VSVGRGPIIQINHDEYLHTILVQKKPVDRLPPKILWERDGLKRDIEEDLIKTIR